MKRKNLRIGNNMTELNFKEENAYLQAKKRVKEIKGFYVHLAVSVLSGLLIVFVNLKFTPGYHFFWFALGGLAIPQLIHGIIVFGFRKFGLGRDWEQKKMHEIITRGAEKNKQVKGNRAMGATYHKEQQYLKAKQQVAKIKSFYAGVIGYCLVIPFLIFVNLSTFPQLHWFWFPAFGWGLGLIFQGVHTFNYTPFLGKGWEENQMKRFMEEEQKQINKK